RAHGLGSLSLWERAGGEGLGSLAHALEAPHPNPLPEGEGKEGMPQNHLDEVLGVSPSNFDGSRAVVSALASAQELPAEARNNTPEMPAFAEMTHTQVLTQRQTDAVLASDSGLAHQRSEKPSVTGTVPARTPVRMSRSEARVTALPLRLQRTLDEAALARGRALTVPAISAVPARMLLATSSTSPPSSSAIQLHEPPSSPQGGGSTSEITDAFIGRTGSRGIGGLLSKDELPVPFPLVQRPSADVSRAVETAAREAVERRVTVATEIRP